MGRLTLFTTRRTTGGWRRCRELREKVAVAADAAGDVRGGGPAPALLLHRRRECLWREFREPVNCSTYFSSLYQTFTN
uniref:Uncharacterized protein n=1 Tax=Kalanchoe fedtschenkoi TaxID=63787 RepID=A0A7N0T3R2_KALFE